jgi:hypothetical protein
MRKRVLICLGVFFGNAGCDREIVAGGEPSTSSGSGGSAATGGAPSGSPSGAGGSGGVSGAGGGLGDPGGCISGWSAAGPFDLDLGESSFRLDSAVTASTGTMVGYTAFIDDRGTVAWRVRAFDASLNPRGPATTIEETTISGGLSRLSLVTSPTGVGALYWTGAGARVAGLTLSGDLFAPPFEVPAFAADMLDALGGDAVSFVGTGNDADASAITLFRASPSGVEEVGPLDIDGFHVGRTNFADGTFMSVWARDPFECADCALHLVARVFEADGSPRSDIVPITTKSSYGFISPGPRLVTTQSNDGVAVGVASQLGIQVYWLDPDGVMSPAPLSIPAPDVQAISIAEVTNGLLVVGWIEGTRDQHLKAALVGLSPTTTFATWDFGGGVTYGSSPHVARQGDGAVVFVDGWDPSADASVLRAATIAPCGF